MHLRNLVTWAASLPCRCSFAANANGSIFLSLCRRSSAQILLGSIESASYSTTPHHLSTHPEFGRVAAAFSAPTFIMSVFIFAKFVAILITKCYASSDFFGKGGARDRRRKSPLALQVHAVCCAVAKIPNATRIISMPNARKRFVVPET